MLVGLKDLKAYQAGLPGNRLMVDARRLWIPIMVGDSARTKIHVHERNGALIPGELGGRRLAKEVLAARQKLLDSLAAKKIKPVNRPTLVKVHNLEAECIYFESAEGEFLVPAMIQPERFQLHNGEVYSLADVLLGLGDYAQSINEDKAK